MVRVSCAERRLYHSRAARDDRDGALPLQGDTSGKRLCISCKQGGTVGRRSAEDRYAGELGTKRGRDTEAAEGGCFEPESERKRPGRVANPQRDIFASPLNFIRGEAFFVPPPRY